MNYVLFDYVPTGPAKANKPVVSQTCLANFLNLSVTNLSHYSNFTGVIRTQIQARIWARIQADPCGIGEYKVCDLINQLKCIVQEWQTSILFIYALEFRALIKWMTASPITSASQLCSLT